MHRRTVIRGSGVTVVAALAGCPSDESEADESEAQADSSSDTNATAAEQNQEQERTANETTDEDDEDSESAEEYRPRLFIRSRGQRRRCLQAINSPAMISSSPLH